MHLSHKLASARYGPSLKREAAADAVDDGIGNAAIAGVEGQWGGELASPAGGMAGAAALLAGFEAETTRDDRNQRI